MKKKSLYTLLFCITIASTVSGQYDPQVPLPGNKAIAKDDPRFEDWASACTAYLGWVNIADKSLGQANSGTTNDAIGPPDEGTLSLGDSGIAVVTFPYTIANGEGPDFAVFENAFADPMNDTMAFLELAFVEVSSDGQTFVRFPAYAQMQDTLQLDNAMYSNARSYHNLAGKYRAGYGTPFDLEELKDSVGIDINNISHIRIVDVIGNINPLYASRDHDGRVINDPYPTPFATSGFDLNAVGVLHSNKPASGMQSSWADAQLQLYPNPVVDDVQVTTESLAIWNYTLTDIRGKVTARGVFKRKLTLPMKTYAPGLYFLHLHDGKQEAVWKLLR